MTSVNPFQDPMTAFPSSPSESGNPANRGFSPSAPSIQTGAGGIVDMILNLLMSSLASSVGIKTDMPSFGRPQVSDYANRSMRDREAVSSAHMAGIYGSSPSSKMFGALGDNALSQQFGDMLFQSGGSRGDAFKQVMGRFGSQMNEGPGGLNVAARGAGQVIRNLDESFTDEQGFWDYSKTGGFNRKNTISAVAEFTSEYGGKDVIDTLSNTKSSTDEVETASKKIQEMTEAVREAGNFFGPNMPFDQLMKEMKILSEGATGSSAASMKSTLQKVQAMAVTVDMSNEAFNNYMKVIKEINTASGGEADIAKLSIASMIAGKAAEEVGMKEAAARGEIYTGPSKEESGAVFARGVSSNETSDDAINANVIMRSLVESGSSKAQEAAKMFEERDFAGIQELYEKEVESGSISARDAEYISKEQQAIKEAGGLTKNEASSVENLVLEGGYGVTRNSLEKNKVGGTMQAKNIMQDLMDNFMFNDSAMVEKAGGQENADKITKAMQDGKIVKNVKDFEDIELISERLIQEMPELNYTKEQALEVAKGLRTSQRGFSDEDYKNFTIDSLNPEIIEERKKTEERQRKQEVSIKDHAESAYAIFSDKTMTEAGVEAAAGIYSDLSDGGKEVTWEKFIESAKVRGMEALGGEKGARKLYEETKYIENYNAEKAKEYSDRGLDENDESISDEVRQEIKDTAQKRARDQNPEVATRMERVEKIREEVTKEVKKDAGFKDSDPEKEEKERELIDKITTERIDKEEEDLGIKEKEESKDKGSKTEKEKDTETQKLIEAIQENTKAQGNTSSVLGTLAKGIPGMFGAGWKVLTGNH